jgi:uncharacterized membrane protein (DUF2068 family)
VGTDAAVVRPQDALVVRQDGPMRWYRCLRCDSWLVLAPPEQPERHHPPERERIRLPLRGRPLRDRFVLRIIALERGIHVIVLGALAAAIILFATHRAGLRHAYYRILADLQGALGGPRATTHSGIVHELNHIFTVNIQDLYLVGSLVAAYTAVLLAEAVGLWRVRRWAEYLTAFEASVFLPFEVYELVVKGQSPLKLASLVVNLVIILYLLLVHRLFGIRGGGTAVRREYAHDSGWGVIEAATPPLLWEGAALAEVEPAVGQ